MTDVETDWAVVGNRLVTGLELVSDDPGVLDTPGFWIVVLTFEGRLTCARFAHSEPADEWLATAPPWKAIDPDLWRSSIDRDEYLNAVRAVRVAIADGDVYQANICRLLSAPLDEPPDIRALAAALARGNPAPYAAAVHLPSHGVYVASASPELFLSRDGDTVVSGPIKGTGHTRDDLTPKDVAENVMIVDLVRNDLSRIAEVGGVDVPELLAVEQHPGLVHLVSRVRARLRDGVSWAEILAATSPPGSVSGAPKLSALHIINQLERGIRGAYCGAIGWIETTHDNDTASLAVGIRTFEWRGGRLHLGTGAGITWGSDPVAEWEETELKVRRLLEVVS